MDRHLIILPTYNERENLRELFQAICSIDPTVDVLVVDDNSPDHTADLVSELALTHKNIFLLSRPFKDGLGRAYIEAFQKVLQDGVYDVVTMMDADLSHNPKYFPSMKRAVISHDVVIGSRYIDGGGVTSEWNAFRRLLSRLGNVYLSIIFRTHLNDWTSGYVMIRTPSLRSIDFKIIDQRGYAFISGLKYLLYKSGAKLTEVPIFFEPRVHGSSKMSFPIIAEGVIAPLKIRSKLSESDSAVE